MTFYEDLPKLFPRYGHTSDKPAVPPDKAAVFWDLDTGWIWAVNNLMQWVKINPPFPDFPPDTDANIFQGDFNFGVTPSGLNLFTSTNGDFIHEIIIEVTTPFTGGTDPTAFIGDELDTDRLFPASAVNLLVASPYAYHPYYRYPVTGRNIEIRVTGDATAGEANVYILYDRGG